MHTFLKYEACLKQFIIIIHTPITTVIKINNFFNLIYAEKQENHKVVEAKNI